MVSDDPLVAINTRTIDGTYINVMRPANMTFNNENKFLRKNIRASAIISNSSSSEIRWNESADFDVSDSSWKFLAAYHRDLRDETHRLSPLERGQVETLKQIKKRVDFLDLVDYVTNLSAKNETKQAKSMPKASQKRARSEPKLSQMLNNQKQAERRSKTSQT